jgi:RimJ/RimL family protein N-acetyltransferase
MGRYRGVELSDLVVPSERLLLRPWLAEDAAPVAEIMKSGAMHRFLALPTPYTEADARAFVCEFGGAERAAGTGLDCAVVERETGRLAGSASLRLPVGTRHADIGYWIAPQAQGRGYATEATDALARWAYGHGVHRVELRLDVTNLASAHVALRAGFAFEGIRREFLSTPSGRADLAVFVRTASDPGEPVQAGFPPLPADGLSDDTLLIRPLTVEDLEPFIETERDPVTVGVSFTETPPSRDELRAVVARAGLDALTGVMLRLSMQDVATGGYVGSIQLRKTGPPGVFGVGYDVHPAFRGRGSTARALRLVSAWAFAHETFARLELGAKAENIASQKVALAGGFEPDGIRASRLRNPDGSYADEVTYALVNPRFANAETSPAT